MLSPMEFLGRQKSTALWYQLMECWYIHVADLRNGRLWQIRSIDGETSISAGSGSIGFADRDAWDTNMTPLRVAVSPDGVLAPVYAALSF